VKHKVLFGLLVFAVVAAFLLGACAPAPAPAPTPTPTPTPPPAPPAPPAKDKIVIGQDLSPDRWLLLATRHSE